MAKQMVADLAPNARVASVFVLKDMSLVPFRNRAGKFLNLTLADRSGVIRGRVWEGAEETAARLEPGAVVSVAGRVEEFQGQLQIIVGKIVRAEAGTYDPEALMPRSGRSREELLAWLDATASEVGDPHLRALLDRFLGDPEFRDAFADAPGSKYLHHAYAGGLLEHTLSVVSILLTVADLHPELNRDLLITGGLLHDIGKLQELSGKLSFEYTDVGHFVGHTVLTDRMVCQRLQSLEGFPPHLANLLSHMLLSHHGEKEWGAPVVPVTMEACALHYADNLDARVQGFKQVIQEQGDAGRVWSEYHRSYQRAIYLGSTTAVDGDGSGEADNPARVDEQ